LAVVLWGGTRHERALTSTMTMSRRGTCPRLREEGDLLLLVPLRSDSRRRLCAPRRRGHVCRSLLSRLVSGPQQAIVEWLRASILDWGRFGRWWQAVRTALHRDTIRTHVFVAADSLRVAAQETGATRLTVCAVTTTNVRTPNAMIQHAGLTGAQSASNSHGSHLPLLQARAIPQRPGPSHGGRMLRFTNMPCQSPSGRACHCGGPRARSNSLCGRVAVVAPADAPRGEVDPWTGATSR
jgi:hypothetical protein